MFDGVLEKWTTMAYSPRQFVAFYMARLSADRVLLGGGGLCPGLPVTKDEYPPRAEVIDLATGAWAVVAAPPKLVFEAASFNVKAVTLPCGAVLVFGSNPLFGSEQAVYQPARDRWWELPGYLNLDRRARAVLLPGGRVLTTYGRLTSEGGIRDYPLLFAPTAD